MGKWFEDNPIGKVLAAVCGVILLIMLVLGVVWSLPAPELDEDELDQQAMEALELPVLAESQPIESYSVIAERPVFSQTRRPEILLVDGSDEDDEPVEEEVDAPEVTLAGVVITPEVRMATLRHADHPESLIAFEGQPLEGNFGSWHVSRIDEREITLSSGDGEDIELKLEVNMASMKAPEVAQAVRESEAAEVAETTEVADAEGGGDDEQLSRAEEIRQRIAERREELRRAAEEQQQQESAEPQASAEEKEPLSYSQTIQNMMKRRSEKEQNENQK